MAVVPTKIHRFHFLHIIILIIIRKIQGPIRPNTQNNKGIETIPERGPLTILMLYMYTYFLYIHITSKPEVNLHIGSFCFLSNLGGGGGRNYTEIGVYTVNKDLMLILILYTLIAQDGETGEQLPQHMMI
ncbi:hypothetical protein ACJX0J_010658 [Zea mays]